jgi:hypothetical protein
MDRRITLSQKRLNHAHILNRLLTDNSYTIAQAAEATGLSKLFEKANFKHFQEILGREKYGIKISYSALHGILTSAGIKSPKTRRPSKKHRRRERKAYEGRMANSPLRNNFRASKLKTLSLAGL